MRVVAVEEHFFTPALRAALGKQLVVDYPGHQWPSETERRLLEVGPARLAVMDDAEIDVQILSPAVPALERMDAETATGLARETNDFLAEVIGEHPTRFWGLAAVPAAAPHAAADELERTVLNLDLRGGLINGQTHGRFLDDQSFWPIFERAEALGVPIYIHPALPPRTVYRAYYDGFGEVVGNYLAAGGWGWHVETGLHALRLVLAGVFDRFPALQLVIGHMGEAIPFMLDRFVATLKDVVELDRPLRQYFEENFHYSTSGFVTNGPLLCAVEVLGGADRLLFAADYPFSDAAVARRFLDQAPVGEDARAKIAHGNAETLFSSRRHLESVTGIRL